MKVYCIPVSAQGFFYISSTEYFPGRFKVPIGRRTCLYSVKSGVQIVALLLTSVLILMDYVTFLDPGLIFEIVL